MHLDDAIALVNSKIPFAGYTSSQMFAYRNIGETLQKYLPNQASILDFGSGPCDKAAVAAALGYDVSACDDLMDDWHQAENNKEKIAAFAKEMHVNFQLLSGGQLPFAPGTFDMIMMHDVLEHLHDSPRDLLNDLLLLAKEKGLLFVTVPSAVNIRKRLDVIRGRTNLPFFDGFYWYPGRWRGHVREYTRDDLEKLCRFLNLEILELRGCDHMVHKLSPTVRSIYLAATALAPDLKDSWKLIARKRPDWQPKKSLSPDELKQVLGVRCPHPLYMD